MTKSNHGPRPIMETFKRDKGGGARSLPYQERITDFSTRISQPSLACCKKLLIILVEKDLHRYDTVLKHLHEQLAHYSKTS